eukprot:CAMPEP_0182430452 /NCGR_PEP_ID=MMETSP1167-20130531/40725_1 /TAXON_ID=2988 /ORGANISM="Mallomonas Sp, Strain CCMP3275" /LENGTH=658 /DNA_ID=CAMNT_0024615565 /DNA_START=91 /DNA_END=2067 /DNA_ORIENTATION=-
MGALIQKPKMQDKLLSKPPFRFLHDTISAVIKTTSFANGLYDADESDSSKVSEKAQKIAYLEKIINVVGICKGAPVDVRAAKIVAGLEPENTNMLLSALADCASSGDGADAVRRVLGGEVAGASASKQDQSPRGKQSKQESKGEVKESKPSRRESKSDTGDSKTVEIEDVKRSEDDPVLAERGRSRGGTRGVAREKPAVDGNGLSGMIARPPGLDAEIEGCDGNWETTKNLLGPIITKPKLTEKLLSKPPFRFLHDLFMEIINATKFGAGLYTPDEMISGNVSEKSQKIEFLDKMTKLVGIQLNTLIEAKAAKIVAGLEPEKTNILLQLLAIGVKNMPDTTNAVRAVLTGEDSLPSVAVAVESKPAPSRSSKQTDDSARAEAKSMREDDMAAPAKGQVDEDKKEEENKEEGEGDGEAKRSMRPTTARRRPPKIKEAAKEVTAKESAAVAKKAEGIMIDGQNDDDDDDVIPEEKRLADLTASSKIPLDGEAEPQSKLVKDIMSRQAEQEAARTAQEEDKPEEKGTGIRLGRLRKTGNEKRGGGAAPVSLGSGDIEKLRKTVQILVQHTGPLGSCMDYIQEDISIMKTELDRWESECKRFEADIENENAKTASILKPLTMELSDLEKQVEEQHSKISSTKASISRNQERIQQNLRAIATA